MQCDRRAYLNDAIEACEAIEQALTGMDLAAYGTTGWFARPLSVSSS
jgi:hypothetical protein